MCSFQSQHEDQLKHACGQLVDVGVPPAEELDQEEGKRGGEEGTDSKDKLS